ncbi:MAG: hypothetical protein PF489_02900, partial [Salinivirgaceae bacterium]|nr:hypothetical protein [Salinivirgaceae bacterium]
TCSHSGVSCQSFRYRRVLFRHNGMVAKLKTCNSDAQSGVAISCVLIEVDFYKWLASFIN